MTMGSSGLVSKEMGRPAVLPPETFALLDNYIAFVRGELLTFDPNLVEQMMRTCDNTWNNENVSPAAVEKNRRLLFSEVDSALQLAREAYVRCLEVRQDFKIAVECISEQDRALRCTTSWVATPPDGRHLRYASPRDTKPPALAHFLRTTIESAAVA